MAVLVGEEKMGRLEDGEEMGEMQQNIGMGRMARMARGEESRFDMFILKICRLTLR